MNITGIDDGNVIQFKPRSLDEPLLKSARLEPRKCRHGPFLIDEELDTVECERCGERLNPLFVLRELCRNESQWWSHRAHYEARMAELEKRERTKCNHCGKMTRIS